MHYSFVGVELEFEVCFCHVDGPGKLIPLGLVVDLFYGYLHVLTPKHIGGRGYTKNNLAPAPIYTIHTIEIKLE